MTEQEIIKAINEIADAIREGKSPYETAATLGEDLKSAIAGLMSATAEQERNEAEDAYFDVCNERLCGAYESQESVMKLLNEMAEQIDKAWNEMAEQIDKARNEMAEQIDKARNEIRAAIRATTETLPPLRQEQRTRED